MQDFSLHLLTSLSFIQGTAALPQLHLLFSLKSKLLFHLYLESIGIFISLAPEDARLFSLILLSLSKFLFPDFLKETLLSFKSLSNEIHSADLFLFSNVEKIEKLEYLVEVFW